MPNENQNNHVTTSSDIELRSEQVQEILTKVPHWMIRWGNLVILIMLLMVLLFSYFIKYPDINTTQIIVTTAIPPEKLMVRTSGKIESILVNDNDIVEKNTPLAIIENSANYEDVFLLKSIIDTIQVDRIPFPFDKLQYTQLGDVENAYALFQKEYSANDLLKRLKPYQVESRAQGFEASQLKERLVLLESQKSINQSELELEKNQLDRQELLYKKGVIAAQEFEKFKLTYLQSQKNYKNLLSSISQLKSSLNELNRSSKTTTINSTKDAVNLERNVLQSFFQLKKAIKDWELNYVLRTSMQGKVSFLQLWSANQSVSAGDQVFSVVPINEKKYIGKVKALAQNSGKIKKGQTVNIRLANFPDREYGVVKGIVNNISATPDKEGNLLIDVALPNGLETSYEKKIVFQQEMTGTADIVTEDLRLIERLLYQFRDIFSRSNELKKEEK
ncbi:HlyD family efflux transporter periplasmic adaptor subunit [Flavobacterium jejuense]|uniref:HlyD family efflux transporter periplasmic adaptor subunit n=1 Tax=Flavobacterium jejuense TaxID=1544455 RepID=A0ABX0IT24_9FLAO|nr:HlyD family efflux transporter periplasmic adaptor subunit [Flavobacterium jejuense]NHN26673.1 HlyD family efflux transporter periplasmic adaptor subunit [Flavobacterium jejuense]